MKTLVNALMAATLALSLNAHATVLDFEGDTGTDVLPAVYDTNGLTITVHNWQYGAAAIRDGNGTRTLAFCALDSDACASGTSLTLTGTSPFSLTSLDAAGFLSDGTLHFVGHYGDNQTVSKSVDITLDSFVTYALAGLTGLTSLDIFVTGGIGAEIDNLVFATVDPEPPTGEVPEPATLSLLGAALLGMGVARRRGSKRQGLSG
ncbi:PEP-CTERM sorting domain-containing protein [uncultured Massilia sp.]|uniref:PEP-CTERM sorting domain-containing protein n=1 Tax=uncultured Massilia sp. TaxID=169973 RepID=UPI0025F1B3DA|nr:PEP-CTERM sorting domain-containing protein [uncultured Massilia sp.]